MHTNELFHKCIIYFTDFHFISTIPQFSFLFSIELYSTVKLLHTNVFQLAPCIMLLLLFGIIHIYRRYYFCFVLFCATSMFIQQGKNEKLVQKK